MKTFYKLFTFQLMTFLIFPLFTIESVGQNKGEISIYSGYQMLGGVNVYRGDVTGHLDINDAAFYSGSIGFRIRPELLLEIQYLYQTTKVSFDPAGTPQEFVAFNADVHYILAGARFERSLGGNITGYGGLSIGTAGVVPTNSFIPNVNFDSAWRFAFGLTLGAKIMMSNNVGLKVQAQGLFPIQWAGGGLYVGTGGAGYGLSTGTSIAQINVGGGLFYAF